MTRHDSEDPQNSDSQPEIIENSAYDIDVENVQSFEKKRTIFFCYMRSFGTFLGGLFVVIGMMYVQFGGIYHAFKKHGVKDGWISVFVPPYSWFRSIEWFWHDDFSGLDWNKRFQYDIQVSISLLNASLEQDLKTRTEIGQAIEDFSQRIRKYPKDKLEALKSADKTYILYAESMMTDAHDAFGKLQSKGALEFNPSEATVGYEKELLRYPGTSELIRVTKDSLSQIATKVTKNQKAEALEENLPRALDYLERYKNHMQKSFREAFKAIFDEEFE